MQHVHYYITRAKYRYITNVPIGLLRCTNCYINT